MRIKSLHLRSYKRFTDLRVRNIPDSARLVVLIGPNGSGKSSLFDAFLRKSQPRHNHSLVGNSIFTDYFDKHAFDVHWQSTHEVWNAIQIEFHSAQPDNSDWPRIFNIRSAYRNEADFKLTALQPVQQSSEEVRFNRIIDPDQAVSSNYQRLAWQRMADLDADAPEGVTFGEYRSESLQPLQRAMRRLFANPTLELDDFGGVRDSGVFRFTKGSAGHFHYKNLSGGEKAAFDLLLDIFVKRSDYSDAVYCIDEPESHIASALHGHLLQAILELIPTKSQLWIATHSTGFVRKAMEISGREHNVAFLDFTGHDFDQHVEMVPVSPNQHFFRNLYGVLQDDLAGLIAPSSIVLCEGKKSEVGTDSRIYNTIFGESYPDVLFISRGGSDEVEKSDLVSVLAAIVPTVSVWRLIDRDDMTDTVRREKISEGIRVLSRREMENYLWDPCVLEEALRQQDVDDGVIASIRSESSSIDFRTDDIHRWITQVFERIRRIVVRAGKNPHEFASVYLAPALRCTPSVYQELLEDVFPHNFR